jgi:DNA-binding transcriptional MerR regulator
MLYRIGEVAEILGITKEGVRFLERKNLLHSERNPENGYRYYSRSELSVMQQIHCYASVGFTLEEAARLVLQGGEKQLSEELNRRQEELEQEIAAIRKKQELLNCHQEAIRKALSAQGTMICSMPAMYYLPLEGEYAKTQAENRRQIEKIWMSAMPQTMLAKIPLNRKGEVIESKGICVKASEAESCRLPLTEEVRLYPEQLCYVSYISKPVGELGEFRKIYERAAMLGHEPVDDMLTAVLLSTVKEEQRYTISMVRLPVK